MLKNYLFKHKKSFILFIIILISGSLLLGLSKYYLRNQNDDKTSAIPTKINTFTIKTNPDGNTITYSGEVRSRYESDLSFQTGGKIIARNVQSGSVVHKGDVLFSIDTRDLQQSVKNALAQETSAHAQLELAAKNKQRYDQLFQEGAVSKAEYDQYDEQYTNAVAAVNQAEAQTTQNSNQLAYSDLTAPYDGVITAIKTEAGQVVSAGQPIATIAQPDNLEIEFNVPEDKIAYLSVGENASVTFWALPALKLNASIREITPFADNNTRTFKIRASLLQPPPTIKLGMTASLSLAQPIDQNAISIPLTAVYQSESEGSGVWLIRDHKLSFQPVTLGKPADDNKTVYILSGLAPGDCIAAAGVNKLYEGESIAEGDEVS